MYTRGTLLTAMTRYTLKAGFTLETKTDGSMFLSDTQSGDALAIAKRLQPHFRAAAHSELESLEPSAAEVVDRYRPFFVEATEPATTFLSQAENLKQALAQQAPQASAPEVTLPPELLSLPAESAPEQEAKAPLARITQPQRATQLAAAQSELQRSARKPVVLTALGIGLLVLGLVWSVVLKPDADSPPPPPPAGPPPEVAAPQPEETPALPPPTPPEPSPTVGETAEPTAAVDASVTVDWIRAELVGRGRVKMSQLVATKSGKVQWDIENTQRVKAKQPVGTLVAVGETPQPLTSSTVGLVMQKQLSGAAVKKGNVLAELVYMEAWGKVFIRQSQVEPSWRCRVESPSTHLQAECRILLLTARPDGTHVTVAVEPLWFDNAPDVAIFFAP